MQWLVAVCFCTASHVWYFDKFLLAILTSSPKHLRSETLYFLSSVVYSIEICKYFSLTTNGLTVLRMKFIALCDKIHSSVSVSENVVGGQSDGIPAPQKMLFPGNKLTLKWERVYRVGAGLHNLGNTCFLNSTVQCLTYTPPLANYLLSKEHSRACKYSR